MEEAPLVALHAAGAGSGEMVRADGDQAWLIQALVFLVDVGWQAHDGEGLIAAAACRNPEVIDPFLNVAVKLVIYLFAYAFLDKYYLNS